MQIGALKIFFIYFLSQSFRSNLIKWISTLKFFQRHQRMSNQDVALENFNKNADGTMRDILHFIADVTDSGKIEVLN